jgi:energy-coupling factor transporter ATP-binding protein EcfA2
MHRVVDEALGRLGLELDRRDRLALLSPGREQMVTIGRGLSAGTPRTVIVKWPPGTATRRSSATDASTTASKTPSGNEKPSTPAWIALTPAAEAVSTVTTDG